MLLARMLLCIVASGTCVAPAAKRCTFTGIPSRQAVVAACLSWVAFPDCHTMPDAHPAPGLFGNPKTQANSPA